MATTEPCVIKPAAAMASIPKYISTCDLVKYIDTLAKQGKQDVTVQGLVSPVDEAALLANGYTLSHPTDTTSFISWKPVVVPPTPEN